MGLETTNYKVQCIPLYPFRDRTTSKDQYFFGGEKIRCNSPTYWTPYTQEFREIPNITISM
jgi:hypothetical protein